MTSFSSIKSNFTGYLLNCRISYMSISIPPQSLPGPLLHPPLKFTTYPTTMCIYNVLYINILSPISVPRMSMGVVLTTGVWATYHMVPPEENRFLLQQLMSSPSRPTPPPPRPLALIILPPCSGMVICICFMRPSSDSRAPLWSHVTLEGCSVLVLNITHNTTPLSGALIPHLWRFSQIISGVGESKGLVTSHDPHLTSQN